MTTIMSVRESCASFFLAVKRCPFEDDGIRAAKYEVSFETRQPDNREVHHGFGPVGSFGVEGLEPRLGYGNQLVTSVLTVDTFLDVRALPSLTRNAHGNGAASRIPTLKSNPLLVRMHDIAEYLRQAIFGFTGTRNRHWLIWHHDYTTPTAGRAFQNVAVPTATCFSKDHLKQTAGRQVASNLTRTLLRKLYISSRVMFTPSNVVLQFFLKSSKSQPWLLEYTQHS